MDFKRIIEERIAAKAEERRLSKLEEARVAQIALLAKQDEGEIGRQIQREVKKSAPITNVSFSNLVARKRRRPELGDRPAKDLRIDGTRSEPQPPPQKKAKPSPNDRTEEEKPNKFGPSPRPVRNKTNGGWKQRKVVETRKDPFEWYRTTNVDRKLSQGGLQTVAYVKTLITNCIKAVNNQEDTKRHFADLRKRVHEMEFYPVLTGALVKKSKVLDSEGLQQLFDGTNKDMFPWDITADAEALWLRWMGGDLDGHLMRGIEISKGVLKSGKKKTSYRLKKAYIQKKSSNVIGANSLINGQWWPFRICALRDGAHGKLEAGIHGQTGRGAYSVVVAVGGYADRDHGDTIDYCGTASETSTPTKSTSLMLESYTNKQPLRVLRAVNKNSKYAPKEGIRYDGLYKVTDKVILDPKTAMFRFTMERISGQDPIRYKGVEIRPTHEELKELMTIRKLIK